MPGKSHGRRNLIGYSPWGRKESDTLSDFTSLSLYATLQTPKSPPGGRNINLRYADGTTLMAETEDELKSLLIRVKEESERAGLKLNIKKAKIIASDPIKLKVKKKVKFKSLHRV